MSSPYATSESPIVLWNEQAINAAVYIGAIAWGLHISTFFQSTSAILQSGKSSWRWLPFSFILFAMASINICCSISFNELAWIDERNYPGGPLAFIVEQSSRPINTASIATSVVTLFLANSFLVYRTHVLWNKFWVTTALVAFLLVSTVLSVMHCIQAARPDAGLWDDATVKISIPYASVTMTLNILLTVILSWRLLDLRRRLPATINEQVKQYTTVQALVVETAFPYGLASFIFVVLYGLRNAGANLFVPLLVQVEGIVAELILIRMVRGNAWSYDILRRVGRSTVVFRGARGRSPAELPGPPRDDISMFNLRDDGNRLPDAKIAQDVV
ncbi:hypothetical protein ACG7TL_002854 [Trametes sanguinea]